MINLSNLTLGDFILQVVKYWPEKGKSGFIVWRYLLRRDDEVLCTGWMKVL